MMTLFIRLNSLAYKVLIESNVSSSIGGPYGSINFEHIISILGLIDFTISLTEFSLISYV